MTCQEETEQVHLRVLVQALEEVLEWVDHEGEERAVPGQVQALEENACVRSVERRLPMKLGFPVILRNAPSAVHRW